MKRKSFGKTKETVALPNLIESVVQSFMQFKNKGVNEVLSDMFPMKDHSGTYELKYISSEIGTPSATPEDAIMKNLTYSAPLKARFALYNHEVKSQIEQEVFMGDIPYMTEDATFIVNGNERAIVTQLVRSPGIYFDREINLKGKYNYSGKIVPSRGAWIFFEIDNKGIVYVRVDNGKKIPATVFLKAIGIGNNEEILEIFDNNEFIANTLEKDATQNETEALIELFKKIRPNEPAVAERARSYVDSIFFDYKKYDLAPVGRYKLNKKLKLSERVLKRPLARAAGAFRAGEIVNDEMLAKLDGNEIYILTKDEEPVKVIGNGETDARHITKEDIVAAVSYLINLEANVGIIDNIDHLGNRRLRLVGELMQSQFQIGINRIEKFIKERMNISHNNLDGSDDVVTPQSLINIRPLVAAMREFMGSGQLSQYVDQVNPLAELSNKRRTSALGPGGFQKDRAGMDVRDVHYSHYGKLCPIETPEGFGVGLINALSSYARINEYGFLETPYRKVNQKTGKVTNEVHFLTADDEDRYYIIQATDVGDDGSFSKELVTVRYGKEYPTVGFREVDYADVSPKQAVGISANLIPFLDNDDASRALMGCNMQRQALPVVEPEEPFIGTGVEMRVALDTRSSGLAEEDGVVSRVETNAVGVKYKTLGEKTYPIKKFTRTNNDTSFTHRVKVVKGQKVKKGDVLYDSSSSNNGELALGKNCLVAFMPWKGYNYEDAIVLSERLVKEDVFTSIIIKEYSIDVRDTKLGREEITREIPNTGERQRKNLDENGIVRVGAKVNANDILVGKITPRSQEETSAQDRLLNAIFIEKASDYKDNSLTMSHGKSGTVKAVYRLTKEDSDLPNGVDEQIKVYVAEKRKIRPGDKMAGRHGNKGVVSIVLPEEDMPYLPDGTPVDVVLNPLGVPSRMNIGQIMETHLGMVARALGIKFEIPPFDGASDEEIQQELIKAGLPENGKFKLYDGRTGEAFENDVTVGVMYMLKLNHQVKDKIHARSTGPYSLVTQQPLGGKAQMGGQRFGEMEVWALEAHGAASTLQEILTVKSDDIMGRTKLYQAIVKGGEFPEPSMTESLKVLISEIRGLGMDIDAITKDGESIFDRLQKTYNREN